MYDAKAIETAIVSGLKEYVSAGGRTCEVVLANQAGPVPKYPYIAYTITTPVQYRGGTYSEAEDGTKYRPLLQTWSFTAQSDSMDESVETAMRAYDWFAVAGLTALNDADVVVSSLGNINNRDNLITIQYEYRNGFDVTFRLLHTVEMTDAERGGIIETANIKPTTKEV